MNQIEMFEDDRAKYYDEFVHIWILNYQFVLDIIPALLKIKNAEMNNVLVVGCGTGNEIKTIAESNPKIKVTGVDPSQEMLEIAEKKLSHLDNIHLIYGTVDSMDSQTKFNAATLSLVLHFMKDNGAKHHILQSVSDRLKANAPLIIVDIFGDEEEFNINRLLLEKLLPTESHGINISERIASMPERISPISEDRLDELLETTGFTRPIRFFQSAIYGGWICLKK